MLFVRIPSQIVQQYDLVLIMELVDVSQTVWPGFVEQLNQYVGYKLYLVGVCVMYKVFTAVNQLTPGTLTL